MDSEPERSPFTDGDRRDYYRRKIQANIEIEWGSTTLTAQVRDIGPAGLFVELLPPLWVGATFRGRLMVDPVLELDCRVRRVEPSVGMAVSFEFPEGSGKVQLDLLLAALPKA